MDLWEKSKDQENGIAKSLQKNYDIELKIAEDNDDEDGNTPYVFSKKNRLNSTFLSKNYLVTYNHSFFLEKNNNYYLKIIILKNIQKLLLWLIAFFLPINLVFIL